MIKKFFGFTLAEVLITIVIVGVVAALTIPSVIKNYKANVLRTQFYKAYNQVSQVLQKMKFDNGGAIWKNYADYHNLGDKYGNNEFKEDFLKYFKEVKPDNNYFLKRYDDPNVPNGMSYLSNNGGSNIYRINNDFTVIFTINAWRIYLTIDTNTCKKGPNRHGYDVFRFIMTRDSKDKLVPFNNEYGSTCGTYSGKDCSWYALNDISPDNPNIGYWKGLR